MVFSGCKVHLLYILNYNVKLKGDNVISESGQTNMYGELLTEVFKLDVEISEFMQYIRINPTDGVSYSWFSLMVSE